MTGTGTAADPYEIDPNADLDYQLNISSWLGDDTVDSYTPTYDGVLEGANSHSESGGVITFWVQGGTVYESGTVHFRVTTAAGRKNDWTIYFVNVEN